MRIFLLGFMGSGKSHVGKRLAPLLAYEFIDLDHYIEEREGDTISKIFEKVGEANFREIESAALKTLSEKDNIIVSTGGGTACFFDNMEWMNTHGESVFLDVSVSILVERLLPRTATRPLLANKTAEEITAYIEGKLAERRPYYEQASIILKQKSEQQNRVDYLLALFKQ